MPTTENTATSLSNASARPNATDVYAHPARWQQIDRATATRAMSTECVVVVYSANGHNWCSYWNVSNQFYTGAHRADARQLRFYRYKDNAPPVQAPLLIPPKEEQKKTSEDPKEQTGCYLRSIDVECDHSHKNVQHAEAEEAAEKAKPENKRREVKPPFHRLVRSNGILQVAPPDNDTDEITLRAGIRDRCPKHPEWEVIAPDGTKTTLKGLEVKTKVKPERKIFALWGYKPKRYTVEATSCDGHTQRLYVDVYPNTWNQLSIIREGGKEVGKGLEKNVFKKGGKSAHERTEWQEFNKATSEGGEEEHGWSLRYERATSFEQKDLADVDYNNYGINPLQPIARALKIVNYAEKFWKEFQDLVFDVTPDIVGKVELFPQFELQIGGGWVEDARSTQCFFKWRLKAALTVFEASLEIRWAPGANMIPGWIRKYVDEIAQFYLFVRFAGEVEIEGAMGPLAAEDHGIGTPRLGGAGVVKITVGGNLSFMKGHCVSLRVEGTTGLKLAVDAGFGHEPEFGYRLKFLGLTATVHIVAWDYELVDNTWEIMGERDIIPLTEIELFKGMEAHAGGEKSGASAGRGHE